jgi:hypothetical protein
MATALNTLSALMANDIEMKQKRRAMAEEYAYKFQQKSIEDQIARGALSYDPFAGKWVKNDVAPFDPASVGLEASSYTDPVTNIKYDKPEDKLMKQADASLYLSPGRPGVPFPSMPQDVTTPTKTVTTGQDGENKVTIGSRYLGQGGGLPQTQEAFNTLQQAINMGMTESPAATYKKQIPKSTPETRRALMSQAEDFMIESMFGPARESLGDVPGGSVLGVLPGIHKLFKSLLAKNTTKGHDSVPDGLPDDLPPPSEYNEGQIVVHPETGKEYELVDGEWVEL